MEFSVDHDESRLVGVVIVLKGYVCRIKLHDTE